MVSQFISRLVILVVGTLYPAYRSYKAIRTKSVKEYVKWMMYWISFAVFIAVETVADIFIAWIVPFYYELKILFVLWLLLPMTKGSSILYRKFVHPWLNKHEKDIDSYLSEAANSGLSVVRRFSRSGLEFATKSVLQSNLINKGQVFVQGLSQIKEQEDEVDSTQAAGPQPEGAPKGSTTLEDVFIASDTTETESEDQPPPYTEHEEKKSKRKPGSSPVTRSRHGRGSGASRSGAAAGAKSGKTLPREVATTRSSRVKKQQ